MQFGVLVEVLFCETDCRVLGGMRFGALVEVLLGKLDGRVLGGMPVLGASGVLFVVLVTLGRDFRRVVEGMQFGVVVQVLCLGCCLRCC